MWPLDVEGVPGIRSWGGRSRPSFCSVVGTSAINYGGNLTGALALKVRDLGLPLPAGIGMLTPVTDLTGTLAPDTASRLENTLAQFEAAFRAWQAQRIDAVFIRPSVARLERIRSAIAEPAIMPSRWLKVAA